MLINNLEQIKPLGIGLAGAGGVEVATMVAEFNPEPLTQGVSIITQIIILVATLVGLFKKKKSINN